MAGLSTDLEAALNEHIGAELFASHLYLSMSAYFETINLAGFAHRMRVQSDEERAHALSFYQHVVDRGGRVTLGAVEGPRTEFSSPLDAFEHALEHERQVTEAIHKLYARSLEEGDYAAQVFLNGFVQEQVEEEKEATRIAETLRMAGGDGASLFLLDRELAAYQPPG